jgi:hypothetical protein
VDKILGNGLVNAVVIPLFIAVVATQWKGRARRGPRQPEDGLFGGDLLLAGVAYQLFSLGSAYRARRVWHLGLIPDRVLLNFEISSGWIYFAILGLVLVALAVYVHLAGYQQNSQGEWVLQSGNRDFVNLAGFFVLFVVFVANFEAPHVFQAWRDFWR